MLATSGNSAPRPDDATGSRGDIRQVLMTADAAGGVWQYSLDLSVALAERGVETTLAVMGPAMDDRQREEVAERHIPVIEGRYQLEWAQAPWEDVERAGQWLLDLARTLHPDVVHLNGFSHAVLPWEFPPLVVAHSCVRSWWRAVHGVAAPAEWNRYSDAVSAGLRAAGMVIAPSTTMISMLLQEYGAFGAWRVIPNGRAIVDHASDTLPIKSDVVFAAGRLWDEAKNIAALTSVAPRLTWRVAIAGERDETAAGLPSANVTWLGRLDSPTMARWYSRAAIYALPALYEPFGLSVLEAAASGCALVLGDIASLRENWTDAAVFIDPRDRQELATTIQGLIEDPFRRHQLALRAMARARQFTVGRMADAYLEAYGVIRSHTAAN